MLQARCPHRALVATGCHYRRNGAPPVRPSRWDGDRLRLPPAVDTAGYCQRVPVGRMLTSPFRGRNGPAAWAGLAAPAERPVYSNAATDEPSSGGATWTKANNIRFQTRLCLMNTRVHAAPPGLDVGRDGL